jgi:hypothetical protein
MPVPGVILGKLPEKARIFPTTAIRTLRRRSHEPMPGWLRSQTVIGLLGA